MSKISILLATSFLMQLTLAVHSPASFAAQCNYEDEKWKRINEQLEEKKFEDAIRLLEEQRELKCPRASLFLGNYYSVHASVPDIGKAKAYWEEASKEGIPEAFYNLGVMYSSGDGVKKDEELAGRLFLQAAEKNDDMAAAALLKIALKKDDLASAYRWNEMLMGHAQYSQITQLGEWLLTKGKREEALRLMRIAADNLDLDVTNRLLPKTLVANADKKSHAEAAAYIYLALMDSKSSSFATMALFQNIRLQFMSEIRKSFADDNELLDSAREFIWGLGRHNNLLGISHDEAAVPSAVKALQKTYEQTRSTDEDFFFEVLARRYLNKQGKLRHAAESNPDALAKDDTFGKGAFINSSLIMGGLDAVGIVGTGYPFFIEGVKPDVDEAAAVPGEMAWSLLRTGDFAYLSDLNTNHLTPVMFVDRVNDRIYFADGWPDKFFLLEGENILGVSGKLEIAGGRKIVSISKSEFLMTIKGILVFANARFPEALLKMYPEVARDWKIRIVLGMRLLEFLGYANSCSVLDLVRPHFEAARDALSATGTESQLIKDRFFLLEELEATCRAKQESGVRDAAKKEDKERIAVSTLRPETIEMLISMYQTAGDYASAQLVLKEFVAQRPSMGDGWKMSAAVLEAQGSKAEFRDALSKAIDLFSKELELGSDEINLGLVGNKRRQTVKDGLSWALKARAKEYLDAEPEKALVDADAALRLASDRETEKVALAAARALGLEKRVTEFEQKLGTDKE